MWYKRSSRNIWQVLKRRTWLAPQGGNISLLWRHNGRDSCLFRRRSKKTPKLRATGLCAGNSPGTGEFPAQMASNAENVSIWWRHHVITGMCWKEVLGSHCWFSFCVCDLYTCIHRPVITETSYECHDVSNLAQLNYLFNNVFRLKQTKHQRSILLAFCPVNPAVIPHTEDQ